MWIFLNNAFLSIVQDKDDPSMLMVRARLRGDIQRVFAGQHHKNIRVIETPPPADYRFRARIEREAVAKRLFAEMLNLDYTNFKKSVPDLQRHDTYVRVWGEMAREQDRQIRLEEDADLVVPKYQPVKLPPTTVRKRGSRHIGDIEIPVTRKAGVPLLDGAHIDPKPVNRRGRKAQRLR